MSAIDLSRRTYETMPDILPIGVGYLFPDDIIYPMEWNRFETSLPALQALEHDPQFDGIATVLSSRYGRYSLYYLAHQPSTTLAEIADFVTGFEAMVTETVATPDDHERVRIHLYHATLPRLDALDYIDFDVDDRRIKRAAAYPAVNSMLGIDN